MTELINIQIEMRPMRPILFLIILSSLIGAEPTTKKQAGQAGITLSKKNTIKIAKAMGFGEFLPQEADQTQDSIPTQHIMKIDTSQWSHQVHQQFNNMWKSIVENDMTLWSASTGIDSTQSLYNKYKNLIPPLSKKLKTMTFQPPKILAIYSRNQVFLLVVEESFRKKKSRKEYFAFQVGKKVYISDALSARSPIYQVGSNVQDRGWLFKYWRQHRQEIIKEVESKQKAPLSM
jgi:hypothetical protein